MSKLRAFDSLRFDRIDAPFGAPGVTSWNGQTGDVIGTLANIYAFGLGTSPTVDNRFTGPGFSWTFPLVDVGGNSFGTGAFEANVNSDITYWNYVRRAGNHTINTSRTFNLWSINDPTWDGSAGSLAPVQAWVTDDVRYGADTTEPIVSQAQLGVGSYEWRDGGVLFFDATNASSSFSQQPAVKRMARRHYLWNQAVGAPQFVDSADGYGNRITTSVVGINGLVPIDIAQVRYTIGSLNPDDGFGYFLCTGFLEDLNGTEAKGWYAVRSVGSGSSDGKWYSSLAASSGAVPGHMVEWLRGYTDVGAKVMVGGLQLPSVDTTTFPVSDTGAARVVWDDARHTLALSTDAGAYNEIGAAQADSGIISLLTPGPSSFQIPVIRGGYYFVYTSISVVLLTYSGTATSNLVVTVGNNGSHNNVTPAVTASSATLNAFGAAVPVQLALTAGTLPGQTMVDASTEIKYAITVPTGVTAATGRILIRGQWVKV